tara:strand:- start:66 stop:419 length:354 start_codon:yes stop_codon:yes gene_type:complete
MDTFKEEFFPDYNKYKTTLSPNQWLLQNILLFFPRLLLVVILAIISILSVFTLAFILIFILMYFVVGFYLIINDFYTDYDIARAGRNCILFVMITSGLITCLLPSSNILYLTYLMSR